MKQERGARSYKKGLSSERLARLFLILTGWRIREKRLRTPIGEIDVIAQKGPVIAFIEIKTRPSLALAHEAISARQKQRLSRAARYYLTQHPHLQAKELRFDALLIVPWHFPRHIKRAWDAPSF